MEGADVVRFLDELSGLELPQAMRETEQVWRSKYEATYWPQFLTGKSEHPAAGGA